ncbi:FAD-dependent oxidoreductase [Methylonatrum kenyense]|uniref:NAD(P)/FAD-dependent oxidoreductase n=1 Tax=Methylonatrum kenyense TaxID=455253 RepID=UPI0020BE0443|nr:FAD-dependent oxidoreductase [Methylonatrum kenyense]MCK8516209.1 FAD-dependent oxidoreductase [Methylonatrum kenyense]
MQDHVVIIGTGLAGYTTAREFRSLAPEARLTLVTSDDGVSYSKPMLSNALRKGQTAAELAQASAEAMAESLQADVLTGVDVRAIETQTRQLVFDDGQLDYDLLVLAIGADPLPLPFEDRSDGRVHQVNNLQQYAAFREALGDEGRVLLVGGGLIGCEFANDLAEAGYGVDLVYPEELPLPALLPGPAGQGLAKALQDLGVKLHPGCTVETVERHGEGVRAQLSDGTGLRAALVLSAVGLRPRTDLALEAGLDVDRGIKVDRFLATSDDSIFALGDCAQVEGYSLCYVAPLTNAARSLARTLAGERTAVHYPVMPVTVKTSCFRIVAWPPDHDASGRWQHNGTGADLRGEFRDSAGVLQGFYLTGKRIRERMALSREMPPLIAAGVDAGTDPETGGDRE